MADININIKLGRLLTKIIGVFERKILQIIYDSLYNREMERHERRHNSELQKLY